MKTIVIANRKGGVGKTTVAYNLGATYALAGHRVCYIDLDSQGNLTQLCRQEPITLDEFKAVQVKNLSKRVDVLPATKVFLTLENELNTRIDRNSFIRDEIMTKLWNYDYIIIDTAPALSVLNINAFCVADVVHIIVGADAFSLSGLVEMRTILNQVKTINPRLDFKIIANAAAKGRKLTDAAITLLTKEPEFTGISIPNRQHFADCNAQREPALDFEEIRDPFQQLAALI